MSAELTTILGQFGPAGLMGLLWVLERRHAALRERQLSEAHRRLTAEEREVESLLGVVRDSTRAIVALEHTQRHLVRLAERLDARLALGERLAPRPPVHAARATDNAAA